MVDDAMQSIDRAVMSNVQLLRDDPRPSQGSSGKHGSAGLDGG